MVNRGKKEVSIKNILEHIVIFFFFFFFFNSVLRPFQDYFSSYETGQSVGGRKRENPEKNYLTPGRTWLVSYVAHSDSVCICLNNINA